MPEHHFDERIAASYDAHCAERFDPAVLGPTVDFLVAHAGGSAALELGIGTGRVALPLAQRGIRVRGIDSSPEMVARLAAKPGGAEIPVTIGDFATTRIDERFRVVYLVFNTITNLTTQAAQVECFANAAAHLEPGGRFVVEVGVPDLRRLPPGETARIFALGPTYVGVDEYTDLAAQLLTSHHFRLVDGDLDVFSAPFRYVWPAELDLMAALAGMTLLERWSTWERAPFTGEEPAHISVWELPT